MDSKRVDGRRADRFAAAGAVALIAAAVLVGGLLYLSGRPVRASSAPLFAHWLPHIGPGTPAAIAVAVLVVWHGRSVAAVLPWRRLLAASYGAAVVWILSLALVDGWQRGVAGRLTTEFEYLSDMDKVTSVAGMLRGFTGGIVEGWTVHVSGHPPGAFLVFVVLDRIGLGGGAWAATLCIAVGGLIAIAVPVTVRALTGEEAARAAVPFVVLFPGAVWIGVSADGLFAGVTAVGIMLLAVSRSGRGGRGKALVGGLLLGYGLFLSYGLILMAPLAVVAAWRAARSAGRRAASWARSTHGAAEPLLWATLGAGLVAAAFAVAGFWWWDGYQLVQIRYYDGVASLRPYSYWVWANLAALAICAGPAAAPILRRSTRTLNAAAPIVLAAFIAILAADLSGLSKAETERIWLPFAVWTSAAAGLLPVETRRGWLVAQAATALLVNHLLLTTW